jgi:membrane glycosyltransferase
MTTTNEITLKRTSDAIVTPPRATPSNGMTPAGIQFRNTLTRRRMLVAALNIVLYGVLMVWLASVLGHEGWSVFDIAIFACFAVAAPWSVLGFWNAVLGLWALHGARDGIRGVAPYAAAGDVPTPVSAKTAIVMTICNEDPQRALARFAIVRESVEKTGQGAAFSYFVLSDTRDETVGAQEELAFAAWKASVGADGDRFFYRRRTTNEGFKAGNLREFCETRGHEFEFMLTLDADSLMSGDAIVRMVRIGQAWPRIGILQSLVVGTPAVSGYARMFQFGMRNAMRPYTTGSAWWNGDCGPYWGHNALVRIAPFRDHCHLPELPGAPPLGGRILSHDQVEAVMMRRAGFEVRVLPQEGGSWEDNPPTLPEFSRRDLRWCQGNLQYLKLLTRLPGIEPTSRFQLIWAIMMFIGLPAWTAIIALIAFKPLDGENLSTFPVASAAWLYATFMVLYLAPKLAGYIDVALTKDGVKSYGGATRLITGAVIEAVFSFISSSVTTLRTTIFIIGLAFGKCVIWNGQSRDAHAVSVSEAARHFWPQTLFGLVIFTAAFILAPALILPSLPLTLGYLIAAPFAIVTASKAMGRFLQRNRVCAIPEEFDMPPEIAAIYPPKA